MSSGKYLIKWTEAHVVDGDDPSRFVLVEAIGPEQALERLEQKLKNHRGDIEVWEYQGTYRASMQTHFTCQDRD